MCIRLPNCDPHPVQSLARRRRLTFIVYSSYWLAPSDRYCVQLISLKSENDLVDNIPAFSADENEAQRGLSNSSKDPQLVSSTAFKPRPKSTCSAL